MLVEVPFYYEQNIDKATVYPVKVDWNIFTSFSICFFAYTCQVQLLPVYSELINPEFRRIKKIINRSLITDCVFYSIIACAGYFSTFNGTSSIVVERKPLDGNVRDYWMLVGALSICLIMVASLPVNYHPWRYQVFLFCFKRDHFTKKENLIITVIFMTFCTLVAVVFPDITSVLSILGGMCSCTMSYLIPTVAHVRCSKVPWYHCSNLAPILFFGSLTTIGYLSVCLTIWLLITGKPYVGYGTTRLDLDGLIET